MVNKVDLPQGLSQADLRQATAFPVVRLSALTGEGIDDLKRAMLDLALGGSLKATGEMVTQARHHEHLQSCLAYSGPGPGIAGH